MIVWIQWPSVRFGTSRTDCIRDDPPAKRHAGALPQHIPHGLHRGAPESVWRPASLPQHIPYGLHRRGRRLSPKPRKLCLSTSRTDCIHFTDWNGVWPTALPQHIPYGLHQQNRPDAIPQIHAICCELVDSFSDAAKAASALTIFPCFSTVKAIYIAIIDSLGRTIDRFLVRTSPKKSVSLRFA